MNKLFIIDLMPFLYKGHFVFLRNPRMTASGINTSALLGLAAGLQSILKKEKPTHAVLAMDPGGPTFRHEAYAPYKAQRQKMPEDLAASIPYAFELAEALKIPVVRVDGFEADDVMGTLAVKGAAAGFDVYMATPDKAMAVVEACTLPMVIANGVSVMLAAFFLTLLARDRHAEKKERQTHISQTIQSWLLVTVVLAFAVTSFFVFRLQDEMAISQENSLLNLALDETAADISDLSDDNLLDLANVVAEEADGVTDLAPIAEKHNVAEINLIDMKGIIFNSIH